MKINRLILPEISADISTDNKNNIIQQLNDNIKIQLTNIKNIQGQNIKMENIEEVKKVLNEAESLITDCHTLKQFNVSKNQSFSKLTYECQKLSMKLITCKTEHDINRLNKGMMKIEEKQDNITNESGNLVYNILGFIASFSVVSAAVTAINNIKGTINIMIYMIFLSLILIITLIALNNFYKNRKFIKTKLQDNYFLCKVLVVGLMLLFICKGTLYIKENIKNICESIGAGIEKVRIENQESNGIKNQ